jgi:hypothetical protein
MIKLVKGLKVEIREKLPGAGETFTITEILRENEEGPGLVKEYASGGSDGPTPITWLHPAGEPGLHWHTSEEPAKVNSWCVKSYEHAEKLAKAFTTANKELWLAVDHGPHRGPRYDVTRCPKVGDEVSYGFNGDYYPDGAINTVSKTGFKVVTTTGSVYRRKKKSAGWMKEGGTWSLVLGIHKEKNPSF